MGQDSNVYRSCEAKADYESRAQAMVGLPSFGRVYKCQYCWKWHRTTGTVGKIARLAEYASDPAVNRKLKRAEKFARRRSRRHYEDED
jgi:hypothetical protein